MCNRRADVLDLPSKCGTARRSSPESAVLAVRKDVPQLRGYILQRPEQMLYTGSTAECAYVRDSLRRLVHAGNDAGTLLGVYRLFGGAVPAESVIAQCSGVGALL